MIKVKSRIPSRVLTLLLVLAMLMSFVPGVSATGSQAEEAETLSAIPFTDVKESSWYYENVVYVYENNVMIGTGNNKFEPETTVTRAQFVKAISNMAEVLGYDTTGYLASDVFKDVKAGMYYDAAMGWAKQNDILQGTGSSNAEPEEVVTREQMATFLYRYVDFLGYVLNDTEELNYSDGDSVSTWAADAVTALTKAGVFNGISANGTILFKPQEASTRAQMAALLHRLLDGAMYAVLIVDDGEDYVVSETETYGKVVLGENSTISADEAKDYSRVTLTVDGVEMSILSGKTYTGVVVLTPVKNLGDVKEDWTGFRAAVYVDDSGINSDYSAPAAVISGDVTATSATNVVMSSKTDLSKWQESFNGILINKGTKLDAPQGVTLSDYLNNSITFDYTISNPDISYTGPGGNDFLGLGAAVMVSGNSKVLLEGSLKDSDITAAAASVKSNSNVDLTKTYDTNINNSGQVRTTLVAEESSVVVVDGAYTKATDGEWIEGYVASVRTDVMKSVPWMLGLYGNVRANNLLDNSTAIYYNSIMESENWGVLSTDESKNVQVEVNNSIVRGTGVSTYGAYAIGNANISFTDSYVFTPTYAVIAANGASTTEFKDTEIYSGRAGVMYHSGEGSTITFTDSQVQVVRELALMRGNSNTIFNVVVDNSDISFTGTGDNILVQLMDNDDVLDFATMNTTANFTDPAFAYGNKDNSLVTATDYYNNLSAASDGKTSTATFKNTAVAGDIYNSSVEGGADLAVTLSGATLEGVVSSSVGLHEKETIVAAWDANGQTGSKDYELLAKLTNYAFASVGNDVSVSLTDGSIWTVTGTSYLTSLTIEDAEIVTADGYKVTLSVDGVEQSIVSDKTYSGNVVLNVTKAFEKADWSAFRTAVYVDDNGINSDYSAIAAVVSGDVTDTSAANVVMQSETDLSKWQESFNGILVNVGTKLDAPQGVTLANYLSGSVSFDYTISNPDISYTGPGGNDFLGIGASVMVSGSSKVLLQGSLKDSDIDAAAVLVKADSDVDLTDTYTTNINNAGQVRTTLVAEESSVVVVDGAYTKASDGEWIEGYVASVRTDVMKSVPWMLGLYGNVRANNLLDNATAIYYNSIMEGENWGVLSTDESDKVQVEVNNSIVRGTGVSTYGVYAIGNANVSFTDSYVFTPTYAVIAANGASTTEFKDTEVYSDRAGAMYHSGDGSTIKFTDSQVQVGRELAIMRGSSNFMGTTAFNLAVDSSDINFTGTEDNILVQLMDNDDVLDGDTMMTTVNFTDPAFAYGTNDNSLETATAYYNSLSAVSLEKTSTATFKDVTVAGDIYNSAVGYGVDLAVTLSGTTLEGVVSSSVGLHDKETIVAAWDANGQTGSDDYKLLGKLTNYAFASVGNDVSLSLTDGSTWTVTGTSYLTSLTIEGSSITAPDGGTLTMTVAGVETPIEAGTYNGAIVITIA